MENIFTPKIISLSVFVLSYLLFIFLPQKRMHVAIIGALLLVLLGVLTPLEAFSSINWNVMGMFVGMLVVADIFMESRVPAYLAEIIVNKSKNTAWSILLICVMTGFISAFVENVATVLIVAPIALSLAKKLKINPINMMIAIAVSSNLQGTATLIGDPPSMLLGGFANMGFMDFFFYQGKPSIFWAVQCGALVSLVVLYFVFRNQREKVQLVRTEKVKSWVPTIMLIILILLLATSTLYERGFAYTAGVLCMAFAFIGLIWAKFIYKRAILKCIKELDWETTLFLVGVFVLVGSFALTGWIDTISTYLSAIVGNNIFLGYTLLVVVSVVVSAFVDNVPFLVAMLPIASSMAHTLNISPSLFLFGILIGASLGGNITPIGASANIVACSILKKEGYEVSFGRFMKIGIPFTIAAVSAAYLFVWLVWR